MPSPPDEAPVIVALLIGELSYMTTLNPITTQIVERAAALWRRHAGALLVCEAEPMAEVARRCGVPPESVRVAIPEPSGHTTRWAAQRIAAMPGVKDRTLMLVTHGMHGARAARMFRAVGLRAVVEGLDLPFNPRDPDWKLRSTTIFRIYDTGAWAYCFARGWL